MFHSFFHIVLAIIGLGFLVFIHELGHYFVARRKGMRVEVFSIGFGKAFYSWKVNGVLWQVCFLPFGGYVKIAGMQKEGALQPHQIADGFFGKSPWARMQVAFAGPIVNILFAMVVFSFLWFIGGREKRFSELTNRVGFVDPQSELFQQGLRPGDALYEYNGHTISNFKDFLIASVTTGENVELQGEQIDALTGEKNAFRYQYINPKAEKAKTIPILPAQQLIYSGQMPPESAMVDSNISMGSRLLWANGELLFSVQQLSNLINESTAFLTVQRGSEIFQSKVPRASLSDLKLSAWEKGELDDWQHESGVRGRLQDLSFIPYSLSQNCMVENRLQFLDEKDQEKTFVSCERCGYFNPLQEGDKILAVDGEAVVSSYDLLKKLQTRSVLLIVQKQPLPLNPLSADQVKTSLDDFDPSALQAMIASIGTKHPIHTSGNLELLAKITPKVLDAEGKQFSAASQGKLRLGLPLQDAQVMYNPNPLEQFSEVMQEAYRTLVSLVTGNLNPKYVSGPIGIVTAMQHSSSLGVKEALFWMALISLNLGIMNLLPIPVLDGGHIVFSLWEIIVRKRIEAKTMERLIVPFVVLLIAFFVFVTYHDIARLFSKFL